MRDAAIDRFATPPGGDAEELERGGGDGPRAEKPTIVNLPNALLESERGPRTVWRDAARTEPDFEDEQHRATAPDLDLRGSDEEPRASDTDSCAPDERGLVIDNRYVVESLIATGGMGVVYRCRHKAIGKELAVKIIRKDIAKLAEAPQRLLIEAQAASAIGNEHIIDIRDFGALADGSAYLVMELLDGVPLSELIARHETLPLPRILSIGIQIAEGLQAAHTAGIVHRDLKPENVFLLRRKADDFVKILDFGIAKMRRAEPLNLTRTGVIVGTPDYMSPEQAAGAPIDHRVDIYSLGVILYELAAGRVPFYGSNYMGLLTKIVSEPPPPFRALIPAPPVPPEFEGLVLKCLSKRPGQRFASMTELIEALQGIQRLIGVPVAADGLAEPAPLERPSHSSSASGSGSLYSVPAATGRSVVETSRRASLGINSLGLGLLVLSLGWLWHVRSPGPVTTLEPIVAAPAMRELSMARVPSAPTPTPGTPTPGTPTPGTGSAPGLVDTPGPLVVVTPYVAPAPPESAADTTSDAKPPAARKRPRKQHRTASQPPQEAAAASLPPPPEQRNDDDLLNPWPARR